MFIERLRKEFRSKDHKKIMLTGLYVSALAIFFVLSLAAFITGCQVVFWKNFGISILLLVLLINYRKSGNTKLYAIFLIFLMEMDSTLMMLNEDFHIFVIVYPFFLILGFFFFFRLKTAIWMTFFHFLYWFWIINTFPDHPMFHMTSLTNITVNSIIITVFAFFYHISTEITYAELEHANRQKEILLREIHHRIKNNLNKISSMLGLQILNMENGKIENSKEVLRKSQLRIEAMAMVHDALYRTENLVKINFEEYIKNLTGFINQTYGKNVPVEVRSDDIHLPLERIMSIGLIINELLTNSIKHAAKNTNDEPTILVTLSKDENNYILVYHQTSKYSFNIETFEKSNTLGMKLIRLTIKEMEGEMKLSSGSEWLEFVFSFPS